MLFSDSSYTDDSTGFGRSKKSLMGGKYCTFKVGGFQKNLKISDFLYHDFSLLQLSSPLATGGVFNDF